MPFFHTFGITVTMLTGFELGAKLVTLPKLDLPTYVKALNNHKVRRSYSAKTYCILTRKFQQPTALHLVPSLVPVLVQQRAAINPDTFNKLLTIVTAAAPMGVRSAEHLLNAINRPGVSLQDGNLNHRSFLNTKRLKRRFK